MGSLTKNSLTVATIFLLSFPHFLFTHKLLITSPDDSILLARSLKVLGNPTPKSTQTARERDAREIYLEKKVHELINQERIKMGLRSLTWNEPLAKAARNHSLDMASRRYFKHKSPEDHDFLWRYKQVGFTDSVDIGSKRHLGAENIALETITQDLITQTIDGKGRVIAVSHTPTPVPIDTVASNIVNGWMNSEGHRKNILTPYWWRQGIGVAIIFDQAQNLELVYITENFC